MEDKVRNPINASASEVLYLTFPHAPIRDDTMWHAIDSGLPVLLRCDAMSDTKLVLRDGLRRRVVSMEFRIMLLLLMMLTL